MLVVNLDHYMTKIEVTSDLQSIHSLPPQELRPVIRIFGSTTLGQRACLHLHGILPYIYFRPESMYHAAFDSYAKISRILPVLEGSLEDILHMRRLAMMKRKQPIQQEIRRKKHIHHLDIVKKRSIYGMWQDEVFFIKAYLNDPNDKQRLASVLNEGALAGISMQAYEAHIPYLLQFTSDYNVAPMSWIQLKNVKFRLPLPDMNRIKPKQRQQQQDVNVGCTPSSQPSLPINTATSSSSAAIKPPTQPSNNPIQRRNDHKNNNSLSLESPIFNFLLSTNTSPAGPLKSNEDNSDQEVNQHSSGHSHHLLFTQQSVPSWKTWKDCEMMTNKDKEKYVNRANLSNVLVQEEEEEVTASDQLEIETILAEIKEDDLIWSQYQQSMNNVPKGEGKSNEEQSISNKDNGEALPPTHSVVANRKYMEKESTCELELDTHGDFILNKEMKKAKFASELWDEERLRCAKQGIEIDEQVEMPASRTMTRLIQQKEFDYLIRFLQLQEKGKNKSNEKQKNKKKLLIVVVKIWVLLLKNMPSHKLVNPY
eukprot:gene9100-10044_t